MNSGALWIRYLGRGPDGPSAAVQTDGSDIVLDTESGPTANDEADPCAEIICGNKHGNTEEERVAMDGNHTDKGRALRSAQEKASTAELMSRDLLCRSTPARKKGEGGGGIRRTADCCARGPLSGGRSGPRRIPGDLTPPNRVEAGQLTGAFVGGEAAGGGGLGGEHRR